MNKRIAYLGILFIVIFLLSACALEPEAAPTAGDSQSASSENEEVLEENEYYKISRSGFTYYYTIFDKDHNIAKNDGPLNREPHIVMIDNNLLRFTLQTGTGIMTQWGYYYSEVFNSIHDQYDGKVAYTGLDKVVIQDIFDADKYYYEISSFEYPLSSSVAAEVIISVKFVNDGASVEISCFSGDNSEEVTETVDIPDFGSDAYYNSYYCYGDHPLFDDQVSQNGLDRAYLQESSELQKRADLEGCERKYIALWKEELEFSISELRTHLSADQNNDTEQIILDANQAMESLWGYEYSLRDTKSEGQELTFRRLYEEKEWYRNMTMRIKYLIYTLSCEDNPKYEITWKYQEIR